MYIIRKSQNPYLEQAYKVVFQKILVYLALYDRFYLGTRKTSFYPDSHPDYRRNQE